MIEKSDMISQKYKVRNSPYKKVSYICFNESSLKTMNNAFHFSFKALFVLKIFTFFPKFFLAMYKNGLIRKLKLISKFMRSQTETQTTAINIFPNISKSKDNQTMKFVQLIEYNVRNIFPQKLCRK